MTRPQDHHQEPASSTRTRAACRRTGKHTQLRDHRILTFEEYKGTSNAELRLDRKIASKGVYPAIDIGQSSTRKEELLLSPEELVATRALRRALDGRDSQQAIDMLLDGLRKTPTNSEFLTQLTRTIPE